MSAGDRRKPRITAAVALLLSLAAAIIGGLAFETWRIARAHRAASERVLQDYASFAAWSFGTRVRTTTFFAINPVFAGADAAPKQTQPVLAALRSAADSIELCRCGMDLDPQFVFIAELGTDFVATQRRDSTISTDVMNARTREIAALARVSLSKGVASRAPGAIPYRWATGGAGKDEWIAFYGVLFRSDDDSGVIFGFTSKAASFADVVLSAAARGAPLLPASLVRATPTDSLLSVTVLDTRRNVVFDSRARFKSPFRGNETLGNPDTALVISVAMNPRVADRLIIGGLPPSPFRTILPLVSLAVALLAFAVYLTRRQEIQTLELRTRLSEARLATLRGQLNPHFLFNVLNSIAMLARKGDTARVVQAVTELASLLRSLLRDSPNERIPLSEELRFIEQYLSLERIRFQSSLRAAVRPDPSLETSLVPAFILQPIVENALRHGVARNPDGGRIDVRTRKENGSLVLEVEDDGAGFEGRPGEGLGLRITRERLSQIYGDRAKLTVSSSPGRGTLARVTLPVEWLTP